MCQCDEMAGARKPDDGEARRSRAAEEWAEGFYASLPRQVYPGHDFWHGIGGVG